MLQNFFLKEISDLRREMKDLVRTTVTANTGQASDDNEFSGADENLKFLRNECRNKDKIINILLKNLFERENTNVSYKDNSVKFSQRKISETELRNPKRSLKINSVRNYSNREPIKTFNRFDCLSDDESLNEIPEANDAHEKIISRNKSGKSDTQVKNKYNSGFYRRQGNQRIGNITKKVTVFFGDSIIKDIKGLEISDRENKFFVRHFPGAKTDDMKSYVVPAIKQNPEAIVIHCGTNDLKTEKDHRKIADKILGLSHQRKTDDNIVMISGIVPWNDKRGIKEEPIYLYRTSYLVYIMTKVIDITVQ